MKQEDQCIVIQSKKMNNGAYLIEAYAYQNGLIHFFYYPSKKKQNFKIQLLMILNIEYEIIKDEMKIKQYQLAYHFDDLLFNIIKYPIIYFFSSFLTEIFSSQNYINKNLYKTIQQTVIQLDKQEKNTYTILQAFHKIAEDLGFDIFNIDEQVHKVQIRQFSLDLKKDITKDMYLFSKEDLNLLKSLKNNNIPIDKKMRRKLTLQFLYYFQYHLEKFKASRLESLM